MKKLKTASIHTPKYLVQLPQKLSCGDIYMPWR